MNVKQCTFGARGLVRVSAFSAVAALLYCLSATPAAAVVVDHIAAAVNNEVITGVELEQAVALNERLGRPAGDRDALRKDTLAGLINRRLLVQEAERLRFVEISQGEIAAAVQDVKTRFGSDAAYVDFLKGADMTEKELSRMLGEQLLVEKFTAKKVGLFVRVTREEAERFYTDHADRFAGKRFQEVQKSITGFLTNEKINQQLDAYVQDLRSRSDVRVNPPLPPGA